MPSTKKSLYSLGLLALTVSAILAAQLATASSGAEEPTPAKLYELRIYTAAPGKMEALNQRFRDHTLRLFEKHGVESVAYWTGVEGESAGRLFYVVAYPDMASREQRLINGIAADPEFLQAVKESEVDGSLTEHVDSILLKPTDYSPLR